MTLGIKSSCQSYLCMFPTSLFKNPSLLYTGFNVNLLGSIGKNILFYPLLYNSTRYINKYYENKEPVKSGFISAMISSAISSLIITPLENIKTNMMADNKLKFKDFCFSRVCKMWVYKGTELFIAREIIFSSVYWPILTSLKNSLKSQDSLNQIDNFKIDITAASMAGMTAALVTQPIDTMKTLYQTNKSGVSIHQLYQITVRDYGHQSLMRGTVARVLRIIPHCMIVLSSFNYMLEVSSKNL
eukprot:Mrub_06832.p1 GENE.Mrub_06832~~Mrub_06832.p1  ORF type:complete len:284 (+),score=16.89 Mrub_06832:124-852(+)